MSNANELFSNALSRARSNDRKNIDASGTSRQIGGTAAEGSALFSGALAKARERDRRPDRQLAANSGITAPSADRTLSPSATSFSDIRHAEGALGQWQSDLNLMRVRLERDGASLEDAQQRLAELEANIGSQADVEAYNALVDSYNADLEDYRALYRKFESLAKNYDEGFDSYRELLGKQYEEAERLTGEAAALDERNKAVRNLIGQYELALNGAGTAPEQSLEDLQSEYNANAARARELREQAAEAESRYYGSLRLNDDFAALSTAQGSQREAQIRAGLTPYEAGGAVYDYINDIGNARQIQGYAANGSEYASYGALTDEERAIYNYLYATQGAERAQRFLDDMQETLNYRLGTQRYEDMGSLQRGLYWIPAGLDQFASGLQQLFSREARPTSATQYTSAAIVEGLEDAPVRRTLYELGTTLSNMAPSVLASALGGWALAGAGVGTALSGRIAGAAGSALLGASAGGNAYTQALNEGYTQQEARSYAALVGLSEGALQYVLGGIGKLGGVSAERVAAKIAGLDNALGRLARSRVGAPAVQMLTQMASEGTEEGLQELLEPVFRTLIFGEEYDANFADAAYSFLLGALSAGVIEGPGAIGSAIRSNSGVENAGAVPNAEAPAGINFAELDGYLGPDERDYFEGLSTEEELNTRYIELAESDPGGSLDWDSVYRQYDMARSFLQGRETVNGTAAQASPDAAAGTQNAEPMSGQTAAADNVASGAVTPPDSGGEDGVMLPTVEDLERQRRADNATTELERSGILAGASDEDIASAQRISSLLGRGIRFYDGAQDEGTFGTANGYYLDGTIYVNTRSQNPTAQIIAHELTHSVELADAYQELSDLVMTRIRQTGGDLDALRQRKQRVYSAAGVELDETAINQELVAEYVEKHLLTDEAAIQQLVMDNRSLGQRILDWINRLLERIRKNAPYSERQFLMHARDAYSRALRQTRDSERRAMARETTDSRLGQLRDAYAAGEMTDEEFDTAVDAVTAEDGGSQLDEPRFSYGGRNAANANLEALNTAEEMERRDVDGETIRQQTGWFRGMDGKWRFEIDDSGMEYRRDGDANLRRESGYQRLVELSDKWEAGMAGGEVLTESERAEMDRLEKEYGERVFEESYMLTDFIEHSELYDNYPQLRNASLIFEDLPDGTSGYYNYRDGSIHLSNEFAGEPRDVLIHEIQHIIQRYEGFARGASPEYWARRNEDATLAATSAQLYRNTAGEIEARDAAARRRLTAEERRTTPPDLGDGNTVFADDDIPVKARFSIDEDYERELDAWDEAGRPDGEVFILGRTGDVLQGLGARELDIYLRSEKVNNIMQKHPEMTLAEIKRIPEVLDDPIIVAKSSGQSRGGQNTRLTMFGELFAQDGGPVMAVLDLRPVEDGIVINDMQKVNSAYHRNNELNYLRRSELLYVDENRAIPLLQTMGLQIRPTELQRYGSMGNVSYNHQNVNIEGVPFDEVVRTENAPQYSISDPERKQNVMAQLRRYVGGDITTAELNSYLNGQTRAVNSEAGAAQDIIDRAHASGMSVDEFLRFNWDEFEVDGKPGETAQRALDLERLGAARRYSISDPERLRVAEGNVDVVRDATPDEYRRMRNASYVDYPWLIGTGDSPLVQSAGGDGSVYTWRGDLADADTVSRALETTLKPRYSVSDETNAETATELPTEAENEYNDFLRSIPRKAQISLSKAENKLLDAISRALGVPYAARRDALKPMVHEMTLEYMRDGRVSDSTINELFESAYDAGVVIDREYYDQYKPVLDYLKDTELKIAPQDYHDIPDFEAFRRHNFGRLKISIKDETTNIDQVFQELAEMWPELFDAEKYVVPSDQLLRISAVASGIRIARMSLDKALGRNAEAFRNEAGGQYRAMVSSTVGALRDVRRYIDDRTARETEEAYTPQSTEEARAFWDQLKTARRNYERTLARTLLTRADEQAIGRLMRGEESIESLDPERYNIEGITAVYNAKRAYESVAAPLRRWNQARKARLYEQADEVLRNADLWKDKKAGALYSRETMERNIRDIVKDPEDAETIISTYFAPVHEATAQGNKIKNSYRDRVRALKLSRKVADGNIVSEAHAVQLLGEAEDNLRVIDQSKGRISERDGKTREDWLGIIENLWRENPKLDEQKIRGAIAEFRKIYDELFDQMNEVRVRNGYEPVNYRSGYFPHFQPGDGDGVLSQFGRALGIDTQVTALPTNINGLTHMFRPGITWFGNAQERLGFNTTYDAVEGFDRYIEGVTDVITQTDNIQRLRAFANRIRYNTTDEGMRRRIDEILNDPTIKEEDKQNRLEKLYQEGRYTLANYVVDLEEYTNLLANKKSRRDRDIEQDAGRNIYNIMRTLSGRVAANMVAINPASWLTNFVPLTQGWAQLDSGQLLRGMWQTLQSYKTDDGIAAKSTFLTNRKGSDPIVRAWEQGAEETTTGRKIAQDISRFSGWASEVLSSPMEYIDMFVSGSLVRARYNQNLSMGMSEDAAMADADAFAANVIADRSKGSQPTRFGRRNPLAAVLNQFQLEVNNQLSYLFKDLPREAAKAGARSLAVMLLKFAIGAWLFDDAYEKLIGREPALDPLSIINETFGDLTGYSVPNIFDMAVGLASGNVSFETEQVGLTEAGINLATEVAEQLPFVGGLLGGGRLPVNSAIPDVGNLWDAATDSTLAPEYRRQEILDELNAPFSYLVMPFGGSQINRIFDSVRAAIDGGVYTYNSEGERLLQYPFYTDDTGEAAWNALRGATFGVTTFGPGEEWVQSGFPTLTADQTAVYQGMVDAGVSGEDAYELIRDFREAESNEQKRYIINQADISGEGKSVAYYGLMANDNERLLMDELAAGADMGEVTKALAGVKNAQTLEGAQETEFKLRAIRDADLSQDNKAAIYRALVSDRQDEDIMAFLDAGLSFDTYLNAKSEYAQLSEEYEDSAARALAFADWAEGQGVTSEQERVMRDTLAPLRGSIGKMTEAGLDLDAAVEVNDALENLGDGAESTDKYMAVAELPISEFEKDVALEGIMSDSAYAKYSAARDAGIDTYDYCAFLDDIAGISGDGRQERVWALIDNMSLTDEQKDALHIAAGYKETTLYKAPWNR